jgi:hypothetical protein
VVPVRQDGRRVVEGLSHNRWSDHRRALLMSERVLKGWRGSGGGEESEGAHRHLDLEECRDERRVGSVVVLVVIEEREHLEVEQRAGVRSSTCSDAVLGIVMPDREAAPHPLQRNQEGVGPVRVMDEAGVWRKEL